MDNLFYLTFLATNAGVTTVDVYQSDTMLSSISVTIKPGPLNSVVVAPSKAEIEGQQYSLSDQVSLMLSPVDVNGNLITLGYGTDMAHARQNMLDLVTFSHSAPSAKINTFIGFQDGAFSLNITHLIWPHLVPVPNTKIMLKGLIKILSSSCINNTVHCK